MTLPGWDAGKSTTLARVYQFEKFTSQFWFHDK